MRSKRLAATLAGTLAIAACAFAKPFAAETVSTEAKWVVHIDVDAVSKSKTWLAALPVLEKNANFVKRRAEIERIAHVKLPDDLHDVTLYGPSFGEQEAVVIIRADVNEERIKTLLALNDTYNVQTIAGQAIHSWEDKNQNLHAGFSADKRIVVGRDQNTVIKALDVLGGKSEAIKNDKLLPTNADAGLLIYVAGDELAKIGKVGMRSDIIQRLQSGWVTIAENDKGLHVASHIVALDEKVAANVKQVIEGIRAMVSFAGQDNPDAELVSEALLDMTTKAEGDHVDINWQIPMQVITDLLARTPANAVVK